MVIDAGTCLTFDLISSKSLHEGGLISPGLKIRYKSLNDFTGLLPMIKYEKMNTEIGKETNTSIQSGVFEGFVFEINGQIEKFKRKRPNLRVILTGGILNTCIKELKIASLPSNIS